MIITVSDENIGVLTWTLPNTINEALESKMPEMREAFEQRIKSMLETESKMYAFTASYAAAATLLGGNTQPMKALHEAMKTAHDMVAGAVA